MMEKKIVDARGLACPLPVVNAKKAAEEESKKQLETQDEADADEAEDDKKS